MYLKDLNTFPFTITDLGDWTGFTIKEIEPYIELRVFLRRRYFKDGKRIKMPNKYFKFRDCTAEDFQSTKFERKQANTIFNIWKDTRFCIDDPNNEIYLQGDKNSIHNL